MLKIISNKYEYEFIENVEEFCKNNNIIDITFNTVDVAPKRGEGTFNYIKHYAYIEYE